MRLATHLHRSVLALPLLALAVVAVASEPPAIGASLRAAVVATLACDADLPAGPRGLARMPGDLGPLHRRVQCSA